MSSDITLIIPDAHATSEHNNNRFTWLGRFAAELKPDKIICLGDFGDLNSLCSYDKGTKGYEGRRYKKDVEAVLDAQERFFAPIKAAKKKLPQFYMLEGNHEHRIKRAIDHDAAQLDGIISFDDLGYREFGWEVTEYNGSTPGILSVDGVAYAHYHTSGILGRAISGTHPAYQLLSKQFQSCTQGHTHTLDYCVRTSANGNHIHGLVAGVFQDWEAGFAGNANLIWWKGVTIKRNVHDGHYEPQFVSLDTIRRLYS